MLTRPLTWILLAAAVAALAYLAWGRERDGLRRWLPAALRELPPTVPAATLGGPTPAAQARKCLSGGQVIYTDGACPTGTQEHGLSGGTVTVLPAQRPRAAAADTAASAQTPLRRLAGQGSVPDPQERQVEQALRR